MCRAQGSGRDGPQEDDVGLFDAADVVVRLADLDEAAEDAEVGEGAAEFLCRLCAVDGGDEAVRERVWVGVGVEDERAHWGRGARVVGWAQLGARGLEVVEDAREDCDAHCAASEDAELVRHGGVVWERMGEGRWGKRGSKRRRGKGEGDARGAMGAGSVSTVLPVVGE